MLNELARYIHKNAVEHGWWETERGIPELLALVHSEVSEALEEWRDDNRPNMVYYNMSNGYQACFATQDIKNPPPGLKPEGVPVELADVIIRILDMVEYFGIDIDKVIQLKMAYNLTRPYRHGGKLA